MAAQQQTNAAGIADDHGADLERLESNGRAGGVRQLGLLQGDPAQRRDERVRQRR